MVHGMLSVLKNIHRRCSWQFLSVECTCAHLKMSLSRRTHQTRRADKQSVLRSSWLKVMGVSNILIYFNFFFEFAFYQLFANGVYLCIGFCFDIIADVCTHAARPLVNGDHGWSALHESCWSLLPHKSFRSFSPESHTIACPSMATCPEQTATSFSSIYVTRPWRRTRLSNKEVPGSYLSFGT